MLKEKLTASSLASLRKCPRQYLYAYEFKLRRSTEAAPLRMGSAFHAGMEARNLGVPEAEAIPKATEGYGIVPSWATPEEWAVEAEIVRCLLAGYFWYYRNDVRQVVATETVFEIPLVNPQTGAASRTFSLAGKIDGIEVESGALAVAEYKTTSEDIGPDSEYWLWLRCDPQICQYVLAARALGFDLSRVLYDRTRKPTIRPKQVVNLDPEGLRVVLNATGERVYLKNGKPRQTGSTKDGHVLQTHTETATEYGERLLADIGARPEYYYQRREVPILDDQLAEFRLELWQQARQLAEARKHRRWFRNVGPMTCRYCSYSRLCLNNATVDPNGPPPAGYEFLPDAHPELQTAGETQ